MGDPDRSLWVGNLHENVTEEILYELFLQAGPLNKVVIAKDKDGRPKAFAFVTFEHDVSVPYTIQLLDGTSLYGKPIRCQLRPGSCHQAQQSSGGTNKGYQQQTQGTSQGYQQGGSYSQQDNMNPYQNNKSQYHQRNTQIRNTPPNPYQNNQPMRTQTSTPHLHKSNTWHGSNIQEMEKGSSRDQEYDKDHKRYSNRDRSSDRGRHGGGGSDSDSQRNGRTNYERQNSDRDNTRGGASVESQRDRVVRQQNQVNSRGQNRSDYGQREAWQSRSYTSRRGRY